MGNNSLDGCILQYYCSDSLVEDRRLAALPAIVHPRILQFPGIAGPVVEKSRVVVTLVEVLEDAGEHFGLLIGQVDSLAVGFEELAATAGDKEGRDAEDVFVSSEETSLGANADGDYCGS